MDKYINEHSSSDLADRKLLNCISLLSEDFSTFLNTLEDSTLITRLSEDDINTLKSIEKILAKFM